MELLPLLPRQKDKKQHSQEMAFQAVLDTVPEYALSSQADGVFTLTALYERLRLTMDSQWFHMRYKQGRAYTPEAYANDTDYFKDVAKAYSAELQTLYDAGLRNVQFDDPGLACKCPT